MSKGLAQLTEMFPEPGLVETLAAQIGPAERLLFLERLRRHAEASRAALKRQSGEFDKMYEEAKGRFSEPLAFQKLAEAVLKEEQGISEQLYPWIEALEQALAQAPQSATREELGYIKECLDVARGWRALYHDLRLRLLDLAAPERDRTKQTLRAEPVKGEVDWADLSREHIARYPKIRARLAE
jgi:hypothetical protein